MRTSPVGTPTMKCVKGLKIGAPKNGVRMTMPNTGYPLIITIQMVAALVTPPDEDP